MRYSYNGFYAYVKIASSTAHCVTGLEKNMEQLMTVFALSNLYQVQRALLALGAYSARKEENHRKSWWFGICRNWLVNNIALYIQYDSIFFLRFDFNNSHWS